MRHMLQRRLVRWEDREAILQRQPRRRSDELAYFGRGCADAVLGHDPCCVLGHGVRRPRGCSSGATVERSGGNLLHAQIIQAHRCARRGALQRCGVVSGFAQLRYPSGFLGQGGGLLRGPLVRPCLASEAGGDDWPHAFAGVRFIPVGFEAFEIHPYFLATLRHDHVERLQLGHFARGGVEGEAMPVEHSGKLGAGGDHSRAEGADRALLLEQGGGEQAAPFPGRENAGADLHVNVPVRITRTTRPVADADDMHLLDGYDLLLTQRANTSHGVLGEPPPNLRQCVLLGGIESVGDLRVQSGGDRQ